ncbi:unnamed protein product [Coccothraustes coccothraustes]
MDFPDELWLPHPWKHSILGWMGLGATWDSGKFWGFQGCLPGRERIMPKGDLGSATGWMKRFVGMLNLAAAFHPKRSHFAPVWEDKGTRNEREGDFSA